MNVREEDYSPEVEATRVTKPTRLNESIEELEQIAFSLERLRGRILEAPVQPSRQEQPATLDYDPASLAAVLLEGPSRIDQQRELCMSLIKDIEDLLF